MEEILARLFNPGDLVVNLGFGMVLEVFYFWLMSRILPPRSTKVYWVAVVVSIGLLMFFKPVRSPILGPLAAAVIPFMLPIVLLQGTLLARVVVSASSSLALFLGEIAGVSAWYATTGLGMVDNSVVLSHLPEYLFGLVCVYMVVLGLFMSGIRSLVHRFVPCGLEDGEDVTLQGRWLTVYVLFVIMQFTVIFEVLCYAFVEGAWSPMSWLVSGCLLGAFALMDVILFRLIGQSVTGVREEARAEALEASIADYLREVEGMQRLLDDTARLRHDIRNHRAVVELMCERGEYAQAEAYLKAWE